MNDPWKILEQCKGIKLGELSAVFSTGLNTGKSMLEQAMKLAECQSQAAQIGLEDEFEKAMQESYLHYQTIKDPHPGPAKILSDVIKEMN